MFSLCAEFGFAFLYPFYLLLSIFVLWGKIISNYFCLSKNLKHPYRIGNTNIIVKNVFQCMVHSQNPVLRLAKQSCLGKCSRMKRACGGKGTEKSCFLLAKTKSPQLNRAVFIIKIIWNGAIWSSFSYVLIINTT